MPTFEMQHPSGGYRGSATQAFLLVSEIRSDAIVTKDGGLRAVLAVSSTNFVLKSPDEQAAIIARYQAFLNALDFPIQILIQSRRLNIHGYLAMLQERQMQQERELLRVQTEEYIEYVNKLLEFGNIMSKTFYVIVPYAAVGAQRAGFGQRLLNLFNPAKEIYLSNEKFAADLWILNERAARIESGLSSIGLRTIRLHTQELVELLYNSYNLTTVQSEAVDLEKMRVVK